jgi:hypothetical protein
LKTFKKRKLLKKKVFFKSNFNQEEEEELKEIKKKYENDKKEIKGKNKKKKNNNLFVSVSESMDDFDDYTPSRIKKQKEMMEKEKNNYQIPEEEKKEEKKITMIKPQFKTSHINKEKFNFFKSNTKCSILFTSTSSSGKTSLLKHFKYYLIGSGDDNEENLKLKNQIYYSIIDNTKTLIDFAKIQNIDFKQEENVKFSKKLLKKHERITNFEIDPIDVFTKHQFQSHLNELIKDDSFQIILKTNRTLIPDGYSNYFDDTLRLSSKDYTPTIKDLISTGLQSNSVSSFSHQIENFSFSVFDMGSQVQERKKLNTYIDSITDVVYFISLTDHIHHSDDNKNITKLEEGLEYLVHLLENNMKTSQRICILLTKADLLQDCMNQKDSKYNIFNLGFNMEYNYENIIKFYKNSIINLINEVNSSFNINFFILKNVFDKDEILNFYFTLFENIVYSSK